jgi:hypothetical protein
MLTIDPKMIPTLTRTGKFKAYDYMSPWMFIPAYLEVCYKTCSTVFLRSPFQQPARVEIPSPLPPRWHQLVHEWYTTLVRRSKKAPLKTPLVINGQSVLLKPKFDRLVRNARVMRMRDLKSKKRAAIKNGE